MAGKNLLPLRTEWRLRETERGSGMEREGETSRGQILPVLFGHDKNMDFFSIYKEK